MVKLLHSLNHALVQRAVFRFDPDIASLWKLSQEKNTDVAKIKNDMNERFFSNSFFYPLIQSKFSGHRGTQARIISVELHL